MSRAIDAYTYEMRKPIVEMCSINALIVFPLDMLPLYKYGNVKESLRLASAKRQLIAQDLDSEDITLMEVIAAAFCDFSLVHTHTAWHVADEVVTTTLELEIISCESKATVRKMRRLS